ncbi:MAG: NUDIX domain-containing protein [Legionellales bacterium]|nr:NUDIX domain-containing protein [Legionellales bacterium]
MKNKTTIGNVCFLFNQKKDKVLLLKRNKAPMRGMWTGVGGKTNVNEDIKTSCIREVKEETGFESTDVILKGIIRTILDGADSNWILFVYTAITKKEFFFHPCDEGELEWVSLSKISDYNLIGFIKEIFQYIQDDNRILEGTIIHDNNGEITKKILHIKNIRKCA